MAALGKQLGVSSTQVSKYEDGSNRIGASGLLEIAKFLRIPISYFYQDIPFDLPLRATAKDQNQAAFAGSEEARQLHAMFQRIAEPTVRRHVIQLVQALADSEDET